MKFPKVFLLLVSCMLLPANLLAAEGVVLINQVRVMASGGFPYKITQSGSYKLSGNLVVPAGVNGIEIQADNVELDLNGFAISGPGTCNGHVLGNNNYQPAQSCTGNDFADGILSFGDSITIRNGSVRGMGVGVSGFVSGTLVEEIHATNNAIAGITATIVRRCLADNNGSGIFVGGVAENNEASLNQFNGLVAEGATVMGNSLNHNGFDGLVVINGTLYGNNTIEGNTVVDVFVAIGTTLYLSQNNNLCTNGMC